MTMTISEALENLYSLSRTAYQKNQPSLGNDLGKIADVIRSRHEVTDEMASEVMDVYRREVGTVGQLDLLPIDREAMKAALVAALGDSP